MMHLLKIGTFGGNKKNFLILDLKLLSYKIMLKKLWSYLILIIKEIKLIPILRYNSRISF